MTSPEELAAAARRRYRDYLRSVVRGESLFPLELPFKPPKPGEAARRWAELRSEVERLVVASAETRPGASYYLRWEDRNDRLAGAQRLPSGAYFPDEGSFLSFLGKGAEARRFKRDLALVLAAFPDLAAWAARRPERIAAAADRWEDLIRAAAWFRGNPASGLYLREVPAVEDTKFIENNEAILDEILAELAAAATGADASGAEASPTGARAPGSWPPEATAPGPDESGPEGWAGDEAPSSKAAAGRDGAPAPRPARRRSFAERHGLRRPEPLVRIRILDAELATSRLLGIRDLALPPSELERLDLPEIQSALIVENKASFSNLELFLSTPAMRGAMAIFGSGYAAGLAALPWLSSRRVVYWGDIDSHGLRILADLRRYLPSARSVMMDESTFERFARFRSDAPHDLAPAPERLGPEELTLFLRLAALNKANRLEQERIPQAYASAALAEALA